jgi:DNA-binding transcriptional MerR regulator
VSDSGLLRIGELSKRSGVSPELLRAWERRYGLLVPTRSPGGLRLYSHTDLDRVRAMREHLDAGLAAAQAATLALRAGTAEPTPPATLSPSAIREQLATALDHFDEPRAQAILDRALAAVTVDTLLGEVILPYLHQLGTRWERGEATIAHEHFATNVLHGRLLGIARDWGLGIGPVALLACLPGEQHDLGLIAFGLALRSRGWRIVYLGADTPIETVEEISGEVQPDLIVLAAITTAPTAPLLASLRRLARRGRLALAGPAAPEQRDMLTLTDDPITEATKITTLINPRGA